MWCGGVKPSPYEFYRFIFVGDGFPVPQANKIRPYNLHRYDLTIGGGKPPTYMGSKERKRRFTGDSFNKRPPICLNFIKETAWDRGIFRLGIAKMSKICYHV